MNKAVEYSHIPVFGKWEIMESELLLIGEHKSENRNWSESKGPCKGLIADWVAKAGAQAQLYCLWNSHSHCLSRRPPGCAAGRWSCGPQWHPPPPFPPQGEEPTHTTSTMPGPTPAHAFFHPSPCLVHPAQIIQLTLPFSSLVHAAESSPTTVTPFN